MMKSINLTSFNKKKIANSQLHHRGREYSLNFIKFIHQLQISKSTPKKGGGFHLPLMQIPSLFFMNTMLGSVLLKQLPDRFSWL